MYYDLFFNLIYIDKLISLCFCFFKGFDALGDLLKPTIPTHTAPPPPPPQMAIHPGGKLLANDLDSSLANLVGSECPYTSAHIAECFNRGKNVYASG